jgi:quinol monooxygenase YgiN
MTRGFGNHNGGVKPVPGPSTQGFDAWNGHACYQFLEITNGGHRPGGGYLAAMADAPEHDGDEAEVELTIVTMTFEASDPDRLMGVLSKYVVLSRQQDGCRNIDLCASVTRPARFLIIEKWDSPEAQRTHFDTREMVEMAEACKGLLTAPPDIDLLEGISAHDLK